MAYNSANDPSLTYTLEDFVSMKYNDDLTYRNFSIVEVMNNIELIDHCLIDEYIKELISICVNVELSFDEYNKFKYAPDLLAYAVYGSTQLDFIILMANDMIDPKEFNLKKIKLPYATGLKDFLSKIYNSNNGYIEQNRSDNNLKEY